MSIYCNFRAAALLTIVAATLTAVSAADTQALNCIDPGEKSRSDFCLAYKGFPMPQGHKFQYVWGIAPFVVDGKTHLIAGSYSGPNHGHNKGRESRLSILENEGSGNFKEPYLLDGPLANHSYEQVVIGHVSSKRNYDAIVVDVCPGAIVGSQVKLLGFKADVAVKVC